nr:TonB-dependent receptor [Pseudoroseomonas rhizosphaerae]
MSSVRSVYGTDADVDVFTIDNQLQLNVDTGPLRHTVLAGLDYHRVLQDTYTGQSYLGAQIRRQNLFSPVYQGQNTRWPGFSSYSSQRQNQLGAYLQDQVRIDRLVLLFGGRLDWSDSTNEGTNLVNGRRTNSRATDHAFTGRAGAVYLFDNGFAPYVSYSESFEPQSGTDARGNQFEPTRGRQHEVGLRYQPPGTNLLLSVAAFDLVRQNVLSADPANFGFSVQSGETTTRGIELEAKATLAQGLRLTAAYAYQEAEFSSTSNTSTVDFGFSPARTGPTVALEGKTPTGIPRHNASAWLDYTAPEGRLMGLGLGGGVRYLGSSFGDDANTFKVDSATLFDAALRYDLGQLGRNLEGMQAAVNIQNLADTRYVASCYSYACCWYGYGRTVTGSIRYRF